jgi:glycosyltransferase involved in cell wall biosynthesis
MISIGKLNVCFIATTLGQGGAEQQLYYMIQTLLNQGGTVSVLSLSKGEFWEKKILALGVPVYHVGRDKSRFLRLARITRLVLQLKPDFLQSSHFFCNFYTAFAARLLNRKDIGALRSDVYPKIKSGGRIKFNLNISSPTLIAANSNQAIENAVKNGARKSRLYLLPNVVNTKLFCPAINSEKDFLKIICAGRLIHSKRLDIFLELLKIIKDQADLPVKALIAGDGPLRNQLEFDASKMGLLAGFLTFKGTVENMPELYRQADIFISASEAEGTPNVILEAMASGLVVLSTPVGDVPRIITHGENGFLIDAGDLKSASKILLNVVENLDLRSSIAKNAREFILANYSFERLSTHLTELYTQRLNY